MFQSPIEAKHLQAKALTNDIKNDADLGYYNVSNTNIDLDK